MTMKHALKKVLCGSGSTSVLPTKEVSDLIKKGAFVLDVRTIFEAKRASLREPRTSRS
jgi:hypothetical protein